MECPLSAHIRNSSSFHTSCKSSAVSGGQIASFPPCMAIVGGSEKEDSIDVDVDIAPCCNVVCGGSFDVYQYGSFDSNKNDLYGPMQKLSLAL